MKLKFVKNVKKQDKFQLIWNFSCAYFDKTLKSKQEKEKHQWFDVFEALQGFTCFIYQANEVGFAK